MNTERASSYQVPAARSPSRFGVVIGLTSSGFSLLTTSTTTFTAEGRAPPAGVVGPKPMRATTRDTTTTCPKRGERELRMHLRFFAAPSIPAAGVYESTLGGREANRFFQPYGFSGSTSRRDSISHRF